MFNLEGLIPKLCQLAQEVGDDERALQLRAAGLQVLAFMVYIPSFQSNSDLLCNYMVIFTILPTIMIAFCLFSQFYFIAT